MEDATIELSEEQRVELSAPEPEGIAFIDEIMADDDANDPSLA